MAGFFAEIRINKVMTAIYLTYITDNRAPSHSLDTSNNTFFSTAYAWKGQDVWAMVCTVIDHSH
ncbi:hypothetical protein [Oceanobacillus rekensis]|uniref:hypothetical protein n=1 Tax=Oceanobacillus rekensis TaxID=937927 RepID=UPI0015946057|nr:hypothetical protein [Oceanobacillus rekensis]